MESSIANCAIHISMDTRLSQICRLPTPLRFLEKKESLMCVQGNDMWNHGQFKAFSIMIFHNRCNGKVFEAEKQVSKHHVYHKKCFTCIKCKHQLDASSFINGPEPEVYCVHCYKVIEKDEDNEFNLKIAQFL